MDREATRPLTTAPGEDRFRALGVHHLDELTARAGLDGQEQLAVQAVARVLPFRTNDYVVEELIDWSAAPDDPIYRLVVPQADMLPQAEVARIAELLRDDAPAGEIEEAADEIRMQLNPHPAEQLTRNVPAHDDKPLPGVQHKYREIVLFFPRRGQTCHAYCTYCFRWAQFIGKPELKMASSDVARLTDYLRTHREVTDVLLTGGDPLIMGSAVLARYLEPLLDPRLEQLRSIRVGTKALSYWPQRFVHNSDADQLLAAFERVVGAGKHLAVMAHFSHPRELEPSVVDEAVARIRATGAVIRTQAPLMRTINDDPDTWAAMWSRQIRMGMVPYYMFIARDTGPQDYFAVPLAEAYETFQAAYRQAPGLARTVRGPSMSATPGKVAIDGTTTVEGQQVFVLRFTRCRDAGLVGRPFFASFDPTATWLTDLVPAFVDRFPFEN